jgi:hypothetical protein
MWTLVAVRAEAAIVNVTLDDGTPIIVGGAVAPRAPQRAASLRPRTPSPVHHAARARRSASAMMASPHRIASVPQTEPSLLGYGKPLPWKLRNAIDDAP